MTRVKKSGTKLEAKLAELLEAAGLTDFECQARELPGTPDFVWRKQKVALFLDSCYWHGCALHLRMPRSNIEYWENKIALNRARDKRQSKELRGVGWRVIRLWEHELKNPLKTVSKIRRILSL